MEPPSPPARRLLPPLLLAGFVLAFYARVLPQWTTSTVGPEGRMHVDGSLHLWQYEWIRRVLAEGGSLFRTHGLTFPVHVDLLGLWEGHLDLVVGAPFTTWAGPYAAANAASLVHLGMLGAGAWALCRGFAHRSAAAAAAAGVLILSPAVLHEFGEGRIEAGSLGLVALALLWGTRWLEHGRIVHLVGSLVALVLGITGYLHAGPMLALLLPGLVLGAVLSGRPSAVLAPCALRVRGLVLLVGLALVAWASLAFAHEHVSGQGMPFLATSVMRDSAYHGWFQQSRGGGLPLRDLFLPLPLARQAGTGLVLPLLALLSLAAPRPHAPTLPWWIGAAVLHFAAMGTTLALSGTGTVLESPYAWLPMVLPFLLRFQWPQRYLLLADLCLAVLAAIGLAAVLDRVATAPATLPRRVAKAAIPLVAVGAGLLQVSGHWPLPVAAPPPLPRLVHLVAQDRPAAVLEVQVGGNAGRSASWKAFHYDRFQAALVHGAPMCCLELPARQAPVALDRLVTRTPILAWLLHGRWTTDLESGEGPRPEAFGYTHLVVHGHGCGESILPLERFGWREHWLPMLEEASLDVQPHRGSIGLEAPVRREGDPLASRGFVGERSCDQVLAFLSDTYGPPAARESVGDGVVALWRLPRTPFLSAPDPATLKTIGPEPQARTLIRRR
ncbi:MAG: hypothetical protein JXB39_13270 [Deltaproteobacteria bacterium]|nr:hypothetical protein [Deltaproteobacteria bacterium]